MRGWDKGARRLCHAFIHFGPSSLDNGGRRNISEHCLSLSGAGQARLSTLSRIHTHTSGTGEAAPPSLGSFPVGAARSGGDASLPAWSTKDRQI